MCKTERERERVREMPNFVCVCECVFFFCQSGFKEKFVHIVCCAVQLRALATLC